MSDREFDNINGIKVCDQTARDKIPTKTSQLENDSDYATITQVNQAIDNAQLGGGQVDLSGYVTKETGNANQITFADGQTFQAKLDAGMLKGDKGDKGEKGGKGDQGEQGPAGVDGQTPNIAIGTVTTLEAGNNATASITGTTPNLTLNLGIPKGADGSGGTGGSGLTFRDVEENEEFAVSEILIPVESISLNKTSTIVAVGGDEQLTATILPSNATNKTVMWESSDSQIAGVVNGLVTAVAEGTCTITATTVDGNKTATCEITTQVIDIPLESLSLSKSTSTLAKGKSETLTVTFTPSNTTHKNVTWSTSDDTKATVVNGLVTAIAAGEVTITCTGEGGISVSCVYTIESSTNSYITSGLDLDFRAKDYSGTTASVTDRTGKYTGTLTNFNFDDGATDGWTSDGGLKFNEEALSGYNYRTLDFGDVPLNDEFTVEMVFNPNSPNIGNSYYLFNGNNAYNYFYRLTHSSSDNNFDLSVCYTDTSSSSKTLTKKFTADVTTKHYVSFSVDSTGGVLLNVDGTVTTLISPGFSAWSSNKNAKTTLGKMIPGVNGSILYEFRVYTKALSETELKNNYEAYIGGVE